MMLPGNSGVATYFVARIMRMFDLVGGRLKAATWEQIRDAQVRWGAAVPTMLPLDDQSHVRARMVLGRAQPHVLDEALLALFERPVTEGEPDLDSWMIWVVIEALDANWTLPKGFQGEVYVGGEARSLTAVP
jgi:hypothetical protein